MLSPCIASISDIVATLFMDPLNKQWSSWGKKLTDHYRTCHLVHLTIKMDALWWILTLETNIFTAVPIPRRPSDFLVTDLPFLCLPSP